MPQGNHPKPEKKITLAGGVGVAIWLNTIDTSNGRRKLRSITIAPRRYKDPESGEWKDAPSYRPADLPALIFALEKAQEYCYTVPLPGEQHEEASEPSHIPF